MYVSSLIISGFKSIEYAKVTFSKGKNVIVGKNNAGKSNITKALDLLLGARHPNFIDITESDFHTRNDQPSSEFWVLATLDGDDINVSGIAGLKRGFYTFPLDEKFFEERGGQVYLKSEFFGPESEEHFNSRQKVYIGPQALSAFSNRFFNISKICLVYHVTKTETTEDLFHRDFKLIFLENGKWYVIMSPTLQLRDTFLTSAILPAFRDPFNQLRINNYGWYGKILKKIWEEKRNDDFSDANGECISLNQLLEVAFESIKSTGDQVYDALTKDIKAKIKIAFSDTDLSFRLFVAKGDVHKQTKIVINDGYDSLLEDKGSGIQSAVIIGLFAYYCSKFHSNTSLLAVEEPELYLHPQARRVISHRLSDFVRLHPVEEEAPRKFNQVIVTTHSSEFIKAGELSSISVVRKHKGQTIVSQYPINASDSRDIQTLLKSENSEMFFADAVIICEGGEKHILPLIADHISGSENILDELNISIVRANGKIDIEKYVRILKTCKIPSFTLADLDYFYRGLKVDTITELADLRKDVSSLKTDAADVLLKSGSLYRNDGAISKTMNPASSNDATKLCELIDIITLDSFEESKLVELKSLWEHFRPRISRKITGALLKNPDFHEYRSRLHGCLDNIWNNYDLYILRQGELEDYYTDKGRLVSASSKDTKLLSIIHLLAETPSENLADYLCLDEFEVFLRIVIDHCHESKISASPFAEGLPAMTSHEGIVKSD